ncbi:MAG: NADPH-dependent FMN reductase [Alphaproteobacteria bacterium]
MPGPRILVFAGSTRTGALSAKVAAVAAKELSLMDADVTLISLADYPLPMYHGDDEQAEGLPRNATQLARLLAAHQGVFVSSPEYNRSLPPLLKNALDWISRVRSTGAVPYRHRVYAIAGSSDGRFGGARAVIDLRKILAAAVRGIVIPEQFELPHAQHAFNESGELLDRDTSQSLQDVTRALVDTTRRLAPDIATH